MDKEGQVVDHYDKVHLAPFGEYIPYQELFPFLQSIVPGGGVTPGKEQKVLDADGRILGPLICFEVLFAGMSHTLREMGADVLVVVTNLAWFGRSNAIPEELEFGRLRAVENRLPLIHSSNTGFSGVFDPYGRFRHIDSRLFGERFVTLDLEKYNQEWLIGSRMVGALPVAAPGKLLWSGGPKSIPVLLLFGAMIGIALIFLLSPMRGEDDSSSEDSGGENGSGEMPGGEVPKDADGKPLRGVRLDGDF
jgi:apolipoprotein N-acyltransferase